MSAKAQPAPPPPAPIQSVQSAEPPYDPIKEWRIQSLIRRQRADAFFNQLTDAQQRELCDWFDQKLTVSDIHDRIVQKWKMQISMTVVGRTRARFHALDIAAGTENMLDIITDLELDSDVSQASRIQNSLIHLLNRRAFEIALEAPGSEVINDIVANIKALSALEHKRQQLALQREKLQISKQSAQTQHHRVDLNIVPPARPPANTVVVHPEPNHPNPLPLPAAK